MTAGGAVALMVAIAESILSALFVNVMMVEKSKNHFIALGG